MLKIRYSYLKTLETAPFLAKKLMQEKQKAPTDAMIFGSLVDCLVLEPESFDEKFFIFEGDRRTKKGKEDFDAIPSDKIIITKDLLDKASDVAENGKLALEALGVVVPPKKRLYRNFNSDILCSGEPDIATDDVIIDIKTSSFTPFKAIKEFRYDRQVAFYEWLSESFKERLIIFLTPKVEIIEIPKKRAEVALSECLKILENVANNHTPIAKFGEFGMPEEEFREATKLNEMPF
jgi:hypothetical protein